MNRGARAAEKSAACCCRLVLEMTRPVFPLRVTAHSDRPAVARTSSSRPSERSTFMAFA